VTRRHGTREDLVAEKWKGRCFLDGRKRQQDKTQWKLKGNQPKKLRICISPARIYNFAPDHQKGKTNYAPG